MRRTQPTVAVFEGGGRRSPFKENGHPLGSVKDKEMHSLLESPESHLVLLTP